MSVAGHVCAWAALQTFPVTRRADIIVRDICGFGWRPADDRYWDIAAKPAAAMWQDLGASRSPIVKILIPVLRTRMLDTKNALLANYGRHTFIKLEPHWNPRSIIASLQLT